MTSLGAQVRAKLDHPLIDGDSHIVEYMPVFLEFLKDAGGQGLVEQFTGANRGESWYTMSAEERRRLDERAHRLDALGRR